MSAIIATGGHSTVVSDEETWAMQAALARSEGILVEPAGAVALAGVAADRAAGRLSGEDRVAVLTTGAGWKDGEALERIESGSIHPEVASDAIEKSIVEALR